MLSNSSSTRSSSSEGLVAAHARERRRLDVCRACSICGSTGAIGGRLATLPPKSRQPANVRRRSFNSVLAVATSGLVAAACLNSSPAAEIDVGESYRVASVAPGATARIDISGRDKALWVVVEFPDGRIVRSKEICCKVSSRLDVGSRLRGSASSCCISSSRTLWRTMQSSGTAHSPKLCLWLCTGSAA